MASSRPIHWQRAKRDWTIRLSVAVFATLATAFVGPFGSYAVLSFAERIVYWGGMIFAFLLPAVAIRAAIIFFIPEASVPRDIGVALVQGVIMGPLAWLFSMTFTELELNSLQALFEHVVFTTMIMLAPAGIRYHLRQAKRDGAADAEREAAAGGEQDRDGARPGPLPASAVASAQKSLFIDRLDADKRGEPLRVSADGHFLNVRTPEGETRIRMRFGDALRALQAFDGICIHRSHWIAVNQIDKTEIQGRRTIVHLKDGEQLPVSATGLAALEKINLAPT